MINLGQGREPRDLRPAIFVVGAVFLLGLLVLAVNLYRLMVVRYEEFYALSEDNRFKDVRLHALRGQIKDARGEVLVDNRPSYDVFVTPAFCQRCSADVLPLLAGWLGWDEEQRARLDGQLKATHGPQRYQPMSAQVDLTRDAVDVLVAHQYELPGVDVEPVPHRDYKAGPALAHVLGYMNEITAEELTRLNGQAEGERLPYALGTYIGRRGVERSFEHLLRGTDGWVKEVVNARGEVMRDPTTGSIMKSDDEITPRPGNTVVLSIDARLQAEAERAFPGVAGAVVVLESKTGFVLAMVSRPSFDPNEMTGRVSAQRLAVLNRDPLQPMVFRVGAEHYSPGSTFKPVTMLAALGSGAFTANSQVVCNGGYSLGSHRWRCDNEAGHGVVVPRSALQWSCNVFFWHVADVIGIDAIAKVGRSLGLGSVTNFGVSAEVPGVMPDEAYHNATTPGGYQKGMALNTAIGQGDVNVTPLQLAVMYSALANGGDVWQPQVVRRVEAPDGRLVEAYAPKLARHVELPEDARHLIVDALTAVVNEPGGTGFRARLPDVTVAGKTGTAQVVHLGEVRLKAIDQSYWERDHAWFAAFAPAQDPEITVVVLNEHSGFGGATAAPVAGAILKKYFELKKAEGQAFAAGWQGPKAPEPPALWLPPALALPVAPRAAPDAGVGAVAVEPAARGAQ